MTREKAIVVSDGSLESAALIAVAKARCEVVLLDATAGFDADAREAADQQAQWARCDRRPVEGTVATQSRDGMTFLTSLLAAVATAAREEEASVVYLPLRIGLESPTFPRAAEWVQVAEELLVHGLDLQGLTLLAPLLELELWQVVDLAGHVDAPLHPSHVERNREAFTQVDMPKAA